MKTTPRTFWSLISLLNFIVGVATIFALDNYGQPIVWWFRLSGARITGDLLRISGFEVLGYGTTLIVQGVTITLGAACAGLNSLQSMLLSGSVMAYLFFKKDSLYWINVVLLIPIAWMANVLRIALLNGMDSQREWMVTSRNSLFSDNGIILPGNPSA